MSITNRFKLYSFDLFDTLVYRPLKNPTALFDVLDQEQIAQYRFFVFKYFGLRRWRMLSERIARRKNRSKGEDVTLFDIYRVFSWIIKNPIDVLNREIALEVIFIHPIEENITTLHELIATGNQCCIASDMYLPLPVIKKIIRQKLNIKKIDIFLSSELKKTKHTGSLFKHIARQYDISYSEIQHFGDNPHADIAIPAQLGIQTVKLPERNLPRDGQSIFELFSPKYRNDDVFFELGYYLAGPVAWMCAEFIAQDMKKEGISKVFFGARDGYLMKEIFDLMYPEIESHYIRLSRRALYTPAFAVSKDYKDFFDGNITATEFFERVNLICPPELENLKPKKHIQLFIDELERQNFSRLAQQELSTFKGYLENHNFSGKVAFFDLGWRGSLQESLQKIFKNSCDIFGYYFGLSSKPDHYKRKALYFQYEYQFKRARALFQSIPVFEFIFTEPINSLKCIVATQEGYDFEFIDEDQPEQIEKRKIIALGAKTFFEDFSQIGTQLRISDLNYFTSIEKLIFKYICNPSEKVIDAFLSFRHAEGFGGSTVRTIVDNQSKFSINDYRRSFWRSAYVKKQKGVARLAIGTLHFLTYTELGSAIFYLKMKATNRIKKIINKE